MEHAYKEEGHVCRDGKFATPVGRVRSPSYAGKRSTSSHSARQHCLVTDLHAKRGHAAHIAASHLSRTGSPWAPTLHVLAGVRGAFSFFARRDLHTFCCVSEKTPQVKHTFHDNNDCPKPPRLGVERRSQKLPFLRTTHQERQKEKGWSRLCASQILRVFETAFWISPSSPLIHCAPQGPAELLANRASGARRKHLCILPLNCSFAVNLPSAELFFWRKKRDSAMDLAYMCVKPQMRLYVCHQLRLLNPQRNGARFARLPLLASLARYLTV